MKNAIKDLYLLFASGLEKLIGECKEGARMKNGPLKIGHKDE